MTPSTVIFFDLGDTLVVPRLDAADEVAALDVLPFVPGVLGRLPAIEDGGRVINPDRDLDMKGRASCQ